MRRAYVGLTGMLGMMAAAMAIVPAQPAIKSVGPHITRRAPKPPRTPDPKGGRKMRALNAKKGVGTARVCPTMRAIEERRRAKLAATMAKAA